MIMQVRVTQSLQVVGIECNVDEKITDGVYCMFFCNIDAMVMFYGHGRCEYVNVNV